MKLIRETPVLLLLFACARGEASETAAGAVTQSPAVQALPAEDPMDAAISDRVRDAILADEILRYDAGGVQVTTRNAVVTLAGTVHREAVRQRMDLVAHAVGSVSRVVNLLRVDPDAPGGTMESSLDHEISNRVRLAFGQDPLLVGELQEIGVSSKDGVVKLTGTVSHSAVKQRAEVVANAVGSVVRVDNQLRTKGV